jgi:hypothetical protein
MRRERDKITYKLFKAAGDNWIYEIYEIESVEVIFDKCSRRKFSLLAIKNITNEIILLIYNI